MPLIREDNERSKAFTRRALLIGGGQAALFAALAGRMYFLQIVEADRYAMLAEDNRINLRLLPPPRGRILDRLGVPLAINQQNYRVVLVREQTPELRETLDRLAGIIELSEADYQRILREAERKRAFVPVNLRDNLSWEQVSRIEVNAPDLPGVSIEVGQTRHYPYGEAMTHVLGYVSAVSEQELTGDPLLELPGFRIGKQGIEKQYDLALRGSSGNSRIEVNAVGRVIRELARDEGQPGEDMVLTVDAELQTYVQQRLSEQRAAAAAVLDVTNGDVLALGSVPGFDPNIFNTGLTTETWNGLANDPLSPLTNKAIAGTYAPGSTFKMMVALAGLEAGVDPRSEVFCPGFVQLGNARFHCWKEHGHGRLDMYRGIQQSCDVFFYDLSRRVGIDRISEMAMRFGLGAPTGIDMPGERAGVIPTRDWKLANFGEPWQGGETLVTAIGQGFVLATPLQLALMAARIANGGYAIAPRLRRPAKTEPSGPADAAAAQSTEAGTEAQAAGAPDGLVAGVQSAGPSGSESDVVPDSVSAIASPSLGLAPAHLEVVHKAMDLVTNDRRGTAYRARITQEGWEMAGKTGTSQVRRISLAERLAGVTKNEDLPWRRRDHALFVAYAPVDKPRYACAVVVEHGGGGSAVAAPIVRDILTETQKRDPAATPPMRLLGNEQIAEG